MGSLFHCSVTSFASGLFLIPIPLDDSFPILPHGDAGTVGYLQFAGAFPIDHFQLFFSAGIPASSKGGSRSPILARRQQANEAIVDPKQWK